MCRFPSVDIVLQLFTVGSLIGGAVVDLHRRDGDLVGEARTHLVGHDEDQVRVRDQLHSERPETIKNRRHSHCGQRDGRVLSVTRLGDLLHIGQLFRACGTNIFAQIAHIFGEFL